MNILVVDDEKVQIETLRRALRSKGYQVFEALNAIEALEIWFLLITLCQEKME
jgi:CheY-like chemotaxis protein